LMGYCQVEPHSIADDFRWKAVASIAGSHVRIVSDHTDPSST
jgi:hypothetical protein